MSKKYAKKVETSRDSSTQDLFIIDDNIDAVAGASTSANKRT